MKLGAVFIFIFLFNSKSFSQNAEQSVLWKISGNGLKKSSYLFGTIHSVSYKYLDYFPALKQIMGALDKALFEVTNTGPSVQLSPDLEKAAFPPLDSVLTPEEYALVDSFFTRSPFGSIRPHNNEASLGAMLQAAILIRKNQDNNDMFFDEKIKEYFQKDLKKPIYQLDDSNVTAKQSIEFNTPRGTAEILVKYIKDESTLNPILDTVVDLTAYESLRHNLEISEPIPNNGAFGIYDQAKQRNTLWLPLIVSHLKSGSCFIAVGVGHLQYTTGLIYLLKEKGYKLAPVALKRSLIKKAGG